MNLHELVSKLIIDTKGSVTGGAFTLPSADSSLAAFLPEICLCVTIVLILLVRLFSWGRRWDVFYFALAGSGLALFLSTPWIHLSALEWPSSAATVERMEIFTGMLVYDRFTVFMRSVLVGFAFLFAIFTKLSGIPDREDSPDVYTLVLGATLGMCLMASANHLLMVFMAVEMASVPSYVLAGLLKGRRLGSEAALKYSVYGAGTAGVMLYGISLLAGMLNTAHLPTLSARLAESLPQMESGELSVLALAGLMITVGLAFKLSAVPFHFWCPDVFEGATAEINAFLSVASKAAAVALLVRVALGVGTTPQEHFRPGERSMAGAIATEALPDEMRGTALYAVALVDQRETRKPAPDTAAAQGPLLVERSPSPAMAADPRLNPARDFIGKLVAFLAVITCTFGNLAAYAQTNIKRLLAYSTIAHAGYMMMPISALMVLAGQNSAAAETAVSAVAVYIVVYLFMNLGAFSIVAFLRNAMQTEEIADYAGLIRRCPLTVIFFSLILFSLVGLPPLSGFIGKFAIFATLVDGFQWSAMNGTPATYLLALLLVGGLNTAISLFYYLRVVKVMTIDPEPAHRTPFVYKEVSFQGGFVFLLTVPTALLILNWDVLNTWAIEAARYLLT